MRSFNDIEYIEETLRMLYSQTITDFELISLDNHSTDGTREVIEKHMKEGKFLERAKGPYSPGAVLNQGVAGSSGETLVFLNSDASPVDEHWLENLIKPLEDETIGATYGRQSARPDARPTVRRDHDFCFPPESTDRNRTQLGNHSWYNFFSMANSASRREVLEKVPFRDVTVHPEDILWAKEVREAGWQVEYVPDANTMHSHNYTFQQAWRRFKWEGVGDAMIFPRRRGRDNVLSFAVLPYLSALKNDAVHLLKGKHFSPGEFIYSWSSRFAQKFGRYAGFRKGIRLLREEKA